MMNKRKQMKGNALGIIRRNEECLFKYFLRNIDSRLLKSPHYDMIKSAKQHNEVQYAK